MYEVAIDTVIPSATPTLDCFEKIQILYEFLSYFPIDVKTYGSHSITHFI